MAPPETSTSCTSTWGMTWRYSIAWRFPAVWTDPVLGPEAWEERRLRTWVCFFMPPDGFILEIASETWSRVRALIRESSLSIWSICWPHCLMPRAYSTAWLEEQNKSLPVNGRDPVSWGRSTGIKRAIFFVAVFFTFKQSMLLVLLVPYFIWDTQI